MECAQPTLTKPPSSNIAMVHCTIYLQTTDLRVVVALPADATLRDVHAAWPFEGDFHFRVQGSAPEGVVEEYCWYDLGAGEHLGGVSGEEAVVLQALPVGSSAAGGEWCPPGWLESPHTLAVDAAGTVVAAGEDGDGDDGARGSGSGSDSDSDSDSDDGMESLSAAPATPGSGDSAFLQRISRKASEASGAVQDAAAELRLDEHLEHGKKALSAIDDHAQKALEAANLHGKQALAKLSAATSWLKSATKKGFASTQEEGGVAGGSAFPRL